jgi:hypothetical protein
MLIAQGYMVFQGRPAEAPQAFESLGLPCAPDRLPFIAEHMLEVCLATLGVGKPGPQPHAHESRPRYSLGWACLFTQNVPCLAAHCRKHGDHNQLSAVSTATHCINSCTVCHPCAFLPAPPPHT